MRGRAGSRDVVGGAVFAVFGVVCMVSALQIRPDPSAASVLGPRVAPLVIGGLTVLFALVLVGQGLRGRPEQSAEAAEPAEPAEPAELTAREAHGIRPVLVTFAFLAAYVVAFIPVGFVLSTIAFLVALTTWVDRDKILRNVLFGVGFAVVVYALFTFGLGVQLPPGLLRGLPT